RPLRRRPRSRPRPGPSAATGPRTARRSRRARAAGSRVVPSGDGDVRREPSRFGPRFVEGVGGGGRGSWGSAGTAWRRGAGADQKILQLKSTWIGKYGSPAATRGSSRWTTKKRTNQTPAPQRHESEPH